MPSASDRAISGAHHGTFSGPTRVKEQIAASAISITTIGSSAATSTPAFGARSGDVRRSSAIRSASPKFAFSRLPR